MNHQQFLKPLFLYWGLLVILSCEDPFTSMGPQPEYIDKHDHEPMLNVFGVLRPDSSNGNPLTFVHLEESIPATAFQDSTAITDASVFILTYEQNTVIDSVALLYTDCNSSFETSEYRSMNFAPVPGRTYGISCHRDGYPKLTSKTTVPYIPVIKQDSFRYDGESLFFTILRDPLAALYDIYLFDGVDEQMQRIRSNGSDDVRVEFSIARNPDTKRYLTVFAYDVKLSEYMTYNVSIKPNTYRSDYSTVENGYGCFGSMNVLTKQFP